MAVTRLGVGLVGVALVVWTLFLSPAGHYSGDAGVKYIQAHDLVTQGFRTRALRDDATLDPDGAISRVGTPYEWRAKDGRRLGVYSIAFEAVAAPFVAIGLRASFVVPLVGALLTIIGLALLLRRLGVAPPIVVGAVGFCALGTPILFYAAQLFEHTLAAGFVTCALAILHGDGRWREARAGALGAAAAIIRPECYCALSAIGIGLLVARRSIRPAIAFGLGAAAVLLPYWATNLVTAGTWDPLVTVKTAQKDPSSSFAMFLWGEWGRVKAWVLAVPFVVALAAAFAPGRARDLAVWAAAGAALVVGWLVQSHSPARILSGLFTVTPLLFLGLVHARERLLWIAAVGFMAQVVVIHRGGLGGGLQLGARMFLPVVPALCALVAKELTWRRSGLCAALAAGLAALSLRGQVVGMRQGIAIAREAELATEHIATLPGSVVVTSLFWQAPVLSPALNQGKDVLVVPAGQREGLVARLLARGDRAFVYVDRAPLARVTVVSSYTTPGRLLTVQGVELR
jgi:hypothetical protein